MKRVVILISIIFLSSLQTLSAEDYRRIMKVVEKAILSTDLAMYFKKRDRFIDVSDDGEIEWKTPEKKDCE